MSASPYRAERIKYYLFHGPSPKKIMNEYTALTGRPALPPAWSFGLWLSTSFTTNYDEETTTSFIEGMEKRKYSAERIPFRLLLDA